MIDIDKFITSLFKSKRKPLTYINDEKVVLVSYDAIVQALEEQGLEFRDGSIVSTLEEKEFKPKFKVGDKVRLKGSCGWYNVTEIRGVEYYLTSNDVVPCLLPICEQDDWEVEQKPLPLIDGNYILKATEEYRKDRESCGIKDPVMLNEIETAYFAGATLKQRPVEWSEDDNAFLDDIICKVKHDLILNKDEKDWLKSIKQRIGG